MPTSLCRILELAAFEFHALASVQGVAAQALTWKATFRIRERATPIITRVAPGPCDGNQAPGVWRPKPCVARRSFTNRIRPQGPAPETTYVAPGLYEANRAVGVSPPNHERSFYDASPGRRSDTQGHVHRAGAWDAEPGPGIRPPKPRSVPGPYNANSALGPSIKALRVALGLDVDNLPPGPATKAMYIARAFTRRPRPRDPAPRGAPTSSPRRCFRRPRWLRRAPCRPRNAFSKWRLHIKFNTGPN